MARRARDAGGHGAGHIGQRAGFTHTSVSRHTRALIIFFTALLWRYGMGFVTLNMKRLESRRAQRAHFRAALYYG
eukprot:scaffold4111_cov53-Phaeocystis_antarctica.AAC.2